MANGATALQLWDRALDYADMTGSSFPDTDRKFDLLNAGVSKLHGILAHADYFSKTQTIAIVSGTESYALGTDFYKLLEVSWISGNRKYPLRRFRRREFAGADVPRTAGSIEVDYVPQFTRLTVDGDTIDDALTDGGQLPNGWEDHIAMNVAIRLLSREESDTSEIKNERDMLQATFTSDAGPRDRAGAVADVSGRWSTAPPFDYVARHIRYDIRGSNIILRQLISRGA